MFLPSSLRLASSMPVFFEARERNPIFVRIEVLMKTEGVGEFGAPQSRGGTRGAAGQSVVISHADCSPPRLAALLGSRTTGNGENSTNSREQRR